MTTLRGKKIILGITGSIAAYKAAFLTRLLMKAGAEVQVLMTRSATEFITPLTLSTLSKKTVYSDIANGESWNNHVDLGLWADALLIAPATANTLAKCANGFCDNILSATYLSARCPVFFAPAMDLDMWKHPATLENIKRLKSFDNHLIPVGKGELASGLSGEGRMAEPEEIVQFLNLFLNKEKELTGKKVMVTAGPTFEAIDPVRFIGNHSSGKMGIAIAESLVEKGANVTLILGPTKISSVSKQIKTIHVKSAQEMYERSLDIFPEMDAAVLAAAVADYRPKITATQKIKKKAADLFIELEKTPDIATSLGQIKKENQTIVGFALETNNELENAREKLKKKNFDFIVLNSLKDQGAGFNHDTNKITIVYPNNKEQYFELKSKKAVAEDIVKELVNLKKKTHEKVVFT